MTEIDRNLTVVGSFVHNLEGKYTKNIFAISKCNCSSSRNIRCLLVIDFFCPERDTQFLKPIFPH